MNNSKLTYVNLFINLALIVVVVVLLIDKFNNGPAKNTKNEDNPVSLKNESQVVKPSVDGKISIVFINTDTMWSQYEYVKNTVSKLEKKGKEMEAIYEQKVAVFQKDYQDYMALEQGGILTDASRKKHEEKLTKQNSDIEMYKMKIQEEFIVKKQKINEQINDTIINFIKRYRDVNGYTLVLQHSYLNSVLAGDNSIDVTDDVVAKLNEEYRNNIKK